MIPQIQPKGETPSVSRGNLKPPNEDLQGSRTVGSSANLGHALDVVTVPNDKLMDNVGSSASLARSKSKVIPPNHRFEIAGARMPQPDSLEGWRPGAVPVVKGGASSEMKKSK